jgi:uncharacterized delta-60 repeat protein
MIDDNAVLRTTAELRNAHGRFFAGNARFAKELPVIGPFGKILLHGDRATISCHGHFPFMRSWRKADSRRWTLSRRFLVAALEVLERRQLLSGSAAGAIDPSFGQHGIASISIPTANYTNALDMAIQADGKILVAGSAELTSGDQDIALARFNADGSPDESFGTDGVVLTDFSAPDAEASRIVLDGSKILVVGDANGDFALARYNADGSLDTTFGNGGKQTLDLGSDDDKAFGAAIESDGTIVVDGQSGGQLVLVGFNGDGSLDTAFGTNGKTITDAPGFTPSTDPTTDGTGDTLDGSGGVRVLNNGNLLVVSNEQDTDGSGRADFVYYNPNGSVAAFDRGADQSSGPDIVGFAFAWHGKVITFGSNGIDTLQRYNSDASLDTTFGSGGTAVSKLDWGADGAIAPNGQIIVAGAGSVGYQEGVAVARYNADGSLDTSFGVDGIVISPSAGYDGAAAAVDASGNIVAVGSSFGAADPTLTAVRYLPSTGIIAPTAALVSAPELIHSGENQELLSVTYSSSEGLDPNSLQDGNLTVTNAGNSNDTLPTYFLSSTQNADGSVTVIYQVQKDYSGHYFDALDNGSYTISIGDGTVYDLAGAAVPAGTLGSFNINIAMPVGGITGPTAVMNPGGINIVDVTDQTISVNFSTPIGIDANSFGGDLEVTGPKGFDQFASYQSETSNADGTVTATYDLQHDDSHGVFSAADNGTYTVSIPAGAVQDMDGNNSVAATLGTIKVAIPGVPAGDTGPTATLQASDLTDPNARSETFTVTYKGNYAIAANTLDDNDITVSGPNGESLNATFVSSTANSDGSTTATYSVSDGLYYPLESKASASPQVVVSGTPSGPITLPIFFGGLENGVYTVSLVAGQVNDIQGAPAAAATLGTFTVNRPASTAPVVPVPFDSSQLSLIASGSNTSVDAHHAAVAGLASASPKTTPTRAHVNLPKHKHKHKKKKAAVVAVVRVVRRV